LQYFVPTDFCAKYNNYFPKKYQALKRHEELQTQVNDSDNRKKTIDEQMMLMEKSFQMASKYMPASGTTVNPSSENSTETETERAATGVSRKTQAASVSQVVERTVSALPQEISNKDIIQALAQPRNIGFLTATAEDSKERKNTISTCVYADQTIMDGESVRLRLLEPMRAGEMLICKNTILSGFAKIQGERLQITVNSLEYGGNIIAVELSVYDTDGSVAYLFPTQKKLMRSKKQRQIWEQTQAQAFLFRAMRANSLQPIWDAA
jgi:conjugative transposon TraM protein